jgi:phage baseplate assembly protein W
MVDGDLHFDVNGRLDTLVGFDKVSQDIAEVLLTDLDVRRDFGSELNIVSSDPAYNISEQQVSSYVSDAVDRLRNLQRTNPTTTRQEEIAAVETIEVQKNDQTEILFGLAVRTTAGPSVESNVRLNPTPVRLDHLLPPSTTEQSQEITARGANRNPVVTGEVANDGS